MTLYEWRAVKPEVTAPWITGCRSTHILAIDRLGARYFVPREWVQP